MRKTSLPEREKQICRRLKELRGRLGFSEEAIANRAGISRNRWHNYEMLRSPLKCDVALRICRQLIVSEEWLATGAFKLSEQAAVTHRVRLDSKLHDIYFRNLVDLQAEPEYLDVSPGQLFSNAFPTVLAHKYAELVKLNFHFPRLVVRDSDGDDLLTSYLIVLNDRWLKLLQNESIRLSRGQGLVRRSFLRAQVDFGLVLFKRFMGFQTPEVFEARYNFLSAIANDASCPVGPLHSERALRENTGDKSARDFVGTRLSHPHLSAAASRSTRASSGAKRKSVAKK
jgi:transcriptional regulator with XRE-family HTH domain